MLVLDLGPQTGTRVVFYVALLLRLNVIPYPRYGPTLGAGAQQNSVNSIILLDIVRIVRTIV